MSDQFAFNIRPVESRVVTRNTQRQNGKANSISCHSCPQAELKSPQHQNNNLLNRRKGQRARILLTHRIAGSPRSQVQ